VLKNGPKSDIMLNKCVTTPEREGELMKGKIKGGIRIITIFLFMTVYLTGCGMTEEMGAITESTIIVTDKGVVTSYLVEDFGGDLLKRDIKIYYDMEELRAMLEQEVADFNRSAGNTVTIESVEAASNVSTNLVVALKFEKTEAYRDYSGLDLFYGTVEQAYAAGYNLDITLVSTKADGQTIGKSEILNMGSMHILIAEDMVQIICPKKAQYYSESMSHISDTRFDAADAEGLKYIIMK